MSIQETGSRLDDALADARDELKELGYRVIIKMTHKYLTETHHWEISCWVERLGVQGFESVNTFDPTPEQVRHIVKATKANWQNKTNEFRAILGEVQQ